MTVLPIVERELRVAARRQFTYWSRLAAAGLTLLIFVGLVFISEMGRGAGWNPGQVQFSVLKWMAFAFAAAAGVFFTSDALSEEKREGTLGLLFLTDLRGHDVVLGKLMSHSLQALFGLLAVFPILALPLLEGGVTGAEFGRAMLMIGNALFFSLSLGMFISSMSREVMKAMNGTVLVSLVFLLGLPWFDWWLAGWDNTKFKCVLGMASPGYLFAVAERLQPNEFWFDFGLQNALAWAFLAGASLCIPHAWQEKSSDAKGLRQALMTRWRFGGPRARLARRRKLLPKNPVLWLASRNRWLPRLVWTVMCVGLIVLAWESYLYWGFPGLRQAEGYVEALLVWAMALWVTSQSCRFFVDGVRTGAMELILVTPATPHQITVGQWTTLWRTFLIPIVAVLALQTTSGIQSLMEMRHQFAGQKGISGSFDFVTFQMVNLIASLLNWSGSLLALAWFGMWMGVTTRKTSIAVLKTLGFVFVLPWIAMIFVQIAGMSFFAFASAARTTTSFVWPFWASTALACLLGVAKNVFFIVWSRQRLLNRLREAVARGGQLPVERTSPPLPPAVSLPPLVNS